MRTLLILAILAVLTACQSTSSVRVHPGNAAVREWEDTIDIGDGPPTMVTTRDDVIEIEIIDGDPHAPVAPPPAAPAPGVPVAGPAAPKR